MSTLVSELSYSHWVERFKDNELYCLSIERGIFSPDDSDLKGNKCVFDLMANFLIKTSGSSGESKWVVYSKRRLLEHARLVNAHLEIDAEDKLGLMLPAYHVGGLGVIARAISAKANLAMFDGKWSAGRGLNFLESNGVTVVSLVPTQLVDLVQDSIHCPESIRVAVIGGGKLDVDLKEAAIDLGWPVFESYGMTETGSQIATGAFDRDGYLKVIDGWQVRVGGDGFLEVKGDCLFDGYLVKQGGLYNYVDPKEDGWFKTSDRVGLKVTEEGTGVRFLSRGDQLVKILGELVDVSALENRLMEFVDTEVYLAVLGDKRRGSRLVPVVNNVQLVSKIDGVGWSGLENLEEVVVVHEFPKNEMGKLERSKLVEMVESIVFPVD